MLLTRLTYRSGCRVRPDTRCLSARGEIARKYRKKRKYSCAPLPTMITMYMNDVYACSYGETSVLLYDSARTDVTESAVMSDQKRPPVMETSKAKTIHGLPANRRQGDRGAPCKSRMMDSTMPCSISAASPHCYTSFVRLGSILMVGTVCQFQEFQANSCL